jgi:Ca2+/Na+ antiporter
MSHPIEILLTICHGKQLAVVVAAILQHRTPLALGNVMGSTISNILGAFSLGLLFYPSHTDFDQSAKIYTALQFLVTTAFVGLAYFGKLNRVVGGVLLAIFVIYISSIAYAIYRGLAVSPEMSDSDSDDDCTSVDEESSTGRGDSEQERLLASETSPLLRDGETTVSTRRDREKRASRPLIYHVSQFVIGLVALTISGYILSHSAAAIADSLHLSGTVMGLTVVSFATTLPEKLIAVLGGSRGHSGIVLASTAGSNIFLLTLCVGIIALVGMPDNSADNLVLFELAITWLSSAMLCLVVFLGLGRLAGVAFILLYLVFLVLEFTVYRR